VRHDKLEEGKGLRRGSPGEGSGSDKNQKSGEVGMIPARFDARRGHEVVTGEVGLGMVRFFLHERGDRSRWRTARNVEVNGGERGVQPGHSQLELGSGEERGAAGARRCA
jgi:hypothetical protein